MLSVLKHKISPDDLLSSRLFDERSFYQAFIRDLKMCRKEVIIESPYMTTSRVTTLLPVLRRLVRKGVRVRVNTRFPGHHEELLRIQAWMATKQLRNIGVKVKFFNDYRHRKIAVLDERILWEGSLNILSQGNSREIMRRIESETLTKQMIGFLHLHRFYW
jgi:phosphatidylserine/phosphatidylglycerophosphate/cardiolipin synthase-like enzyme